MNSAPKKEITLDLNRLRDATAIDENAIIHAEAKKKFPLIISQVLQRGEEFQNLWNDTIQQSFTFYRRMHEVIMLSGRRGSGKTTMLLYVLNDIENYNNSNYDTTKTVYSEICSLGVLDPTLLGGREHLLIAILNRIKMAVNVAMTNTAITQSYQYYEIWKEQFASLAKGLKALGDVYASNDPGHAWEDAEFIFMESLTQAQEGDELEKNFHELIKSSLLILKKKAFIIGLDDIDTKPVIGIHVLEILRKYLTTPQLIVLLSGDLELYTSIIHKEQLEAFGLSFSNPENILKKYERTISGLVDQYLNKIIPSRNRIHIPYFIQCMAQNDIYISLNKLCNKKIKVSEFIKEISIQLLCVRDHEDIESISKVILDNPARTVIQFLILASNEIEEVKPKTNITFKKNISLPSHLADIFYESLHRIGFTYADFENLRFPEGLMKLNDAVAEQELYGNDAAMQLRHVSTWFNEAMLVILSALAHYMTLNPSLIFYYMLHVCLPQAIPGKRTYVTYRDTVRNRIYISSSDIIGSADNLSSYIYDHRKQKNINYDLFRGIANFSVKEINIEKNISDFLIICNHQPDFLYLYSLARLPVEPIGRGGHFEQCISIYSILCFMGYIIDTSLDNIESCNITMKYKLYSYIPFVFNFHHFHQEEHERGYHTLINKICEWRTFWLKKIRNMPYNFCSPILIQRVVRLFIQSMRDFDKEFIDNPISQGEYLSDTIAILLNSLYYEEFKIMGSPPLKAPFKVNNYKNSCNFKPHEHNSSEYELNLFNLIITFPLWYYYTNKDFYKEIEKYIKKFCDHISSKYDKKSKSLTLPQSLPSSEFPPYRPYDLFCCVKFNNIHTSTNASENK